MPISMNLKQLKKTLLKKSLYHFILEFWDTYEPFELQSHWTMEYLSECFMFSVKHFLPDYIWKDWISDEKYSLLKQKTGGHCPVRDSTFGGSYVHNHDWNMPPRHSKSSILNVCGPVWLSTISPVTTASVSHTNQLSTEMNQKRKKVLESDKFNYYFGDDRKLQLTMSSTSEIQLSGGAKMYSVCMSSFTGHGADIIIADDLISADNAKKDKQVMKNAITFFRGTLPTRLNNKNTGVIWHIQQRLGVGDISGTILDDKQLRKTYSHTELKAIANKDEVVIFPCSGKVVKVKAGQPLWQERFGDYTSVKAEVGSANFDTQYNQDPGASLDNIIKENYINWISEEEAKAFIRDSERQYASHDCPVKDKESNDFHGYCEGYGKASQLLITDAWEEHLALIKEKELMIRLQTISPSLIQILEDKANGSALYQLLSGEVAGIVPFDPGTDSKTQRLGVASVYVENGSVMFEDTPNVRYLVKQLTKFPFLEHDDIVDAFSQLVIYHFTSSRAGVYTNAFTTKNLVEVNLEANYMYYGYVATISSEKIKMLACRIDHSKDTYTFEKEYVFSGITAIKDFEEFCITNIKGRNILIDCSHNRTLSNMVSNYNIIFDYIDDVDIIKSTQMLKMGFYKQKVLVGKNCYSTINDISKLRIDDQAIAKGSDDKLSTIDEGFAGCVRHLVHYYKGLSGAWY